MQQRRRKKNMNKQNITKIEDGHRTTGIQQFWESLPKHIIPIQKCQPPYQKVDDGYFGYQGVVLLDEILDRVQCHICGRWYKALSGHLKIHETTATNYKERFGLYKNEPLMRLKTLYLFRIKNNSVSKENLKNGAPLFNSTKRPKIYSSHSNKVQFRNKYGTCDAQLKMRIEIAIKKHNGIPTSKQESNLYRCFQRRFGSYEQGLKHYGIR